MQYSKQSGTRPVHHSSSLAILILIAVSHAGTTWANTPPIPASATAEYLSQPVIVSIASASHAYDPNAKQYCLPIGTPVFTWQESAHPAQPLILINTALLGNWGVGLDNEPIYDCRDNSSSINPMQIYAAPAAFQSTDQATPDANPQKDGATYKSVFLNVPLTLAVKQVGAAAAGSICLPKGTRIGTWEDAADKALSIVEIIDSNSTDCAKNPVAADSNKTYYSTTREVSSAGTSFLATAGVLTVPFKYYFNGDKSFTGSASAGPYIGWKIRFSQTGTEFTVALFGGLTTVSVPVASTGQSNSSPPQTNNVSGMSYGIGMFTNVGGTDSSTQAGLVLGKDVVSANANWVNNEKWWLAFQLGYAFF